MKDSLYGLLSIGAVIVTTALVVHVDNARFRHRSTQMRIDSIEFEIRAIKDEAYRTMRDHESLHHARK